MTIDNEYIRYNGQLITLISLFYHNRFREELRRGMESPMVGQAMSMGFRRSHIRQVMTKQIDEHDCRYQSLEALLDGLIFTPENLIDLVSSDDDDDQNNRQPAPDTREGTTLSL